MDSSKYLCVILFYVAWNVPWSRTKRFAIAHSF